MARKKLSLLEQAEKAEARQHKASETAKKQAARAAELRTRFFAGMGKKFFKAYGVKNDEEWQKLWGLIQEKVSSDEFNNEVNVDASTDTSESIDNQQPEEQSLL